jgi:hypothetical protein
MEINALLNVLQVLRRIKTMNALRVLVTPRMQITQRTRALHNAPLGKHLTMHQTVVCARIQPHTQIISFISAPIAAQRDQHQSEDKAQMQMTVSSALLKVMIRSHMPIILHMLVWQLVLVALRRTCSVTALNATLKLLIQIKN